MSQWRRPARLLAVLALLVVLALGTGIIAQTAGNKAVGPRSDAGDPISPKPSRSGRRGPSSSARWWIICPRSPAIPSPKDVLGHHIGEPKKLTYYADILEYYRALAAATPRVKVDADRQEQRGPRPRRRLRRLRRVDQEPGDRTAAISVSWPTRARSPTRRRRRSSRRRSRSTTCRAACTAARSGRRRC